jgi:acyl-CoA synthetase (AMP-forming)/AMP-acid ligase II
MLVIFTSGTTADPKGVVHSHGTYVRHGYNVADANDVRAEQRVFGGMPLFWIGGVSHTLGPLMHRGNTFLCTPKFDPDAAIDLIEQAGATEVYMFPNMAHRLREHIGRTGRDVASIPALAPPPSDVPPDRRASSLGMTETCAAYIASGPRDHVVPEEYRGAHGFPVPMSQYRIVDLDSGEPLPEGVEGEICVRGYSLMLGMCKRERHEIFDDDGWYHTGDKGYLAGGYIFFTGRAKDLIKTAGANVAPREVEVLLDSYPEVLMSVVVGLSDADRGEIVAAALVPAAGVTIDPVDLITRANHDLSSYKVPRRVLIVDEPEVPYLATGKPDRQALAQRLASEGVAVAPVRTSGQSS